MPGVVIGTDYERMGLQPTTKAAPPASVAQESFDESLRLVEGNRLHSGLG